MKLTIRLTTLAITAVALAGVAGAQQQRSNARPGARSQPARSHTDNRPRQDVRPQQYASSRANVRGGHADYQARSAPRGGNGYASRPDPRGGNGYASRPGLRGGNGYQPRNDLRGGSAVRTGNEFRGDVGRRVPIADHGRPLITRANATGREYGRSPAYSETRFGGERGFRGGREFRDGRWFYAGRAFPFGWEGRVVSGGFFPIAYAGYCDAVPVEYDYLLPPMAPSYDPCLFGDRVIVFDHFSRSIVFVATL
jgi:hypothetical protein